MTQLNSKEFGRLRGILWPIHRHEMKKVFPMLVIFFLLFFNYNILRNMKDALVVTAKHSGAEVIPFIKVWVMFPVAILMTFLFTRLSNKMSREKVVYVMTSLFLIYFFIFAFIMYPARDALHLHGLANTLQEILPVGCKGFVAMFRNWTFTSFYVMSELWGTSIIFLLFWGFANQITRIEEAKRFYGIFGIGINVSGILAGQASVYCCRHSYNPSLMFGSDAWEQSMIMLIGTVIVCGVMALLLFRWLNKTVQREELIKESQETENERPAKLKLSMRDSFAYLIRSKYLVCVALIVVSYNLVINLVEVVWKHQVRELYSSPAEYNMYMNQVTTVIGLIATSTAIFVSGNSIRKCGWTFTAMLTPVVLLLTSVAFFGSFFLKDYSSYTMMAMLGSAPLSVVVFFGSLQNILSRAAKYTVFDTTKEMAFVPLGQECKVKGKAAIDGVCSRLGKSSGAFIHQTLLIMFSTIPACAPFVAAILLGVIVVWAIVARALGKQFNALTGKIHQINVVAENQSDDEEREGLLASAAG